MQWKDRIVATMWLVWIDCEVGELWRVFYQHSLPAGEELAGLEGSETRARVSVCPAITESLDDFRYMLKSAKHEAGYNERLTWASHVISIEQ